MFERSVYASGNNRKLVLLQSMVSESEIAEYELMASDFWPAKEVHMYRRWILFWDNGITWRANSVLPYGGLDGITLDEAIEYVIEFYQTRRTPPAFKLTDACRPEGLDAALTQKGFTKHMITLFQTAQIGEISCSIPRIEVDIFQVTEQSLTDLFYKTGFEKKMIDVRRGIIERIEGHKCIARVKIHGNIAGLGLGVVQDEWLGLFSIRTLPEYRGKGVAWSVTCALAIWAEDLGAKNAFLQVEAENKPAIALYESMGFETLYEYWYRILENEPGSHITSTHC
ncbi:MAG: GNAT family N-acetyltransferase [Candidatus Thorarchaeota archaeon]|nr:GNAT family N-acetyltransferase [Candidatus Thorarchaeota archaeon]